MFVTMFYLSVDARSGDLTYVNAGHNPPLLVHCQETLSLAQPMLLTRSGMALGVDPDTPYEQKVVHLEPGDFVVLYTDGVTDAENPAGKPFGMERLARKVLVCAAPPLPRWYLRSSEPSPHSLETAPR